MENNGDIACLTASGPSKKEEAYKFLQKSFITEKFSI